MHAVALASSPGSPIFSMYDKLENEATGHMHAAQLDQPHELDTSLCSFMINTYNPQRPKHALVSGSYD